MKIETRFCDICEKKIKPTTISDDWKLTQQDSKTYSDVRHLLYPMCEGFSRFDICPICYDIIYKFIATLLRTGKNKKG